MIKQSNGKLIYAVGMPVNIPKHAPFVTNHRKMAQKVKIGVDFMFS